MIGFIGFGIMGSRMAANLLDGGHELIVYNRTREKAELLLGKGAAWGDSPLEVAENSDIVFTMLAKPEAVEEVAFSDDGLLNGLDEGKLWVDCSTVDPSFSRKMAQEAKSRGIRFLDAPVAGSKLPAERGELVFYVGGEERDVKQAEPYFNLMGKAINHMGENGMGTSMKVVINLMLAQAMAAFSEAVTLGEAMGLDKEIVINNLVNGATAAPFLQGKKNKVLNNDFDPEFPLEHMQKDLQLVSQAAYESQIALPIANVSKEIYGLAKKAGLGQEDFSAIYSFLNKK